MNTEFLFQIFLKLFTHNNQIIKINLFILLSLITFIIFFTMQYSFYIVVKTLSPNLLEFFNMPYKSTKSIFIVNLIASIFSTWYTFNDATNLLTQIILSKV